MVFNKFIALACVVGVCMASTVVANKVQINSELYYTPPNAPYSQAMRARVGRVAGATEGRACGRGCPAGAWPPAFHAAFAPYAKYRAGCA